MIGEKFMRMGFVYLDKYSGLDPCYTKDQIEFRIYKSYISIWAFL